LHINEKVFKLRYYNLNMKKSWLGVLSAVFGTFGAVSFASAALSVQNILNDWANMGVFSYVLPFLLIFALVYGIITKTSVLGENKAVHAIIALAVGLLSLVGDYVPRFFQTIFPNLGVGLSILLAVVILLGLFYDSGKTKWVEFIMVGVAIAVFLVVAYSSLADVGFSGNGLWNEYGSSIIVLVILAAIISVIIYFGNKGGTPGK
jgi:uncharacterized membrane protein YhdT